LEAVEHTEEAVVPAAISNLESDALHEQIVILESEVARAKSVASEAQKKHTTKKDENAELRARLEELEKEIPGEGEKSSQLQTLLSEKESLESALKELQSAFDHIEARNLSLLEEQKTAGELSANKAPSESAQENQTTSLHSEGEINELRHKIAAHIASFEALQLERNALKSERDLFEEGAKTHASNAKAFSEDREAWREERETILAQLENEKKALVKAQEELSQAKELRAELAANKTALEEAHNQIAATGVEHDVLLERVEELERLDALVEEEFAGPIALRLKAISGKYELGPAAKTGELLVVTLQLADFDDFASRSTPEAIRERLALFTDHARSEAIKAYGSVAHQYGSTLVVVFDKAALPQAMSFIGDMKSTMTKKTSLKVTLDLGAATQVFVGPHACTPLLVGDPLLVTQGALDFAQPRQIVMTQKVREQFAEPPMVVNLGLFSIRGRTVPIDLFQLLEGDA